MNPELAQTIARREEILEKVRRMLIVSLRLKRDPSEIDPDTALFGTGLGMDSLDAVEVVIALEVDFGIRVADPIERKLSLRSVSSLVDLIALHGEADAKGANAGESDASP
jgi:acyl carrier protein